ncbi:hypothetical protein [Salipiger abyssi]|uniref:hypothetical protein n=1 Tax=Salipiger abyssi TaxID=1250539 RepID=UPI001A8D6367|nr:hypothetical protein [Salipiger abyssi]MBN9889385.1 hypothetical protein [Salipiger abyssi]
MPRKEWLPANRYCRNARVDEEQFALLVWFWLGGYSSRAARSGIMELELQAAPSVKTIANYFCRFGYVLSEMTIERQFLSDFPYLKNVRLNDLELYIEIVEHVAEETIQHALDAYGYTVYRALYGDKPYIQTTTALELEVRHISALRKGIKPPYRGDLALAAYRLMTKEAVGEDASDEYFHRVMAENFLAELEERPMDISKYRWR